MLWEYHFTLEMMVTGRGEMCKEECKEEYKTLCLGLTPWPFSPLAMHTSPTYIVTGQ